MKQSINVNTQTYKSVAWGSCDPKTGQLVLYSPEISLDIEESFQGKKHFVNITEFSASVTFDGEDYYQHSTNGGYRHVFREELSDGQTSIERYTEFNEKAKAWYIMPPPVEGSSKKTHIVFAIDTSGSMVTGNLYTKVYTEGCQRFLMEQKTLPHDVRFSALTFSNTVNTVYNNIDLKTTDIMNIQNTFKEIQPGGCTAYYDALMKAIEMTDSVYQCGDEVIICSMTDGFDNSSSYSLTDLSLKIKSRKSMGWNIIMIGTTDIDVDAMSASNGIGRGASIGVSNTTQGVRTAFRSLGRAVADVRSGVSQGIQFTDAERQESAQAPSLPF